MPLYSVDCEAPGGGYGETAVLVYDEGGRFIQNVEYLDLIFDVWRGGELVQDVECYCVTTSLWNYLDANGIKGVSVRGMTTTPGDYMIEMEPDRIIPQFEELVLPRGLRGRWADGWTIEKSTIPIADMFTGPGLPLFVTERERTPSELWR